jgi:lysophospholipase L1-like esterase
MTAAQLNARSIGPGAPHGLRLVLAAALAIACSDRPTDLAVDPQQPPGPDVSTPFPIDRGDEGATTPGSYKGYWLRLVERPAPTITAVDGVIGVVCIGMSNSAQECNRWIQQVTAAWQGEVNPAVRIVNCAVGAHAIERWVDPAFDAVLWDACIANKLAARGVRPEQVRVLYHKAANQFGAAGGQLPPLPAPNANYHLFITNHQAFAARVRTRFPAVQAVYTTGRSYGGFAPAGSPRGEPQAYEESHALNSWLRQNPSVDGVWYGWGPYIWAPPCTSGVQNGAGLCYDRDDYRDDGVHPTAAGELKIARLIHDRFRREPWYRR